MLRFLERLFAGILQIVASPWSAGYTGNRCWCGRRCGDYATCYQHRDVKKPR